MVSGADVLRACRADPGTYERSYCLAYLAGFNDSQITTATLMDWDGLVYCLPDNTTLGAVSESVADYLANNSAMWPEPAGLSVVVALMDAYPCPTSDA